MISNVLRTELRCQILTLKWNDPSPADDIESAARRLRYRALGQACDKLNIGSLLFAHHADDQAETVLMRIANDYLGTGLSGMRKVSGIPECEGMYGVHTLGNERSLRPSRATQSTLPIADDGVSILRPLLSYTKAELIATCEHAGVKWVEDETNIDPSLTLRNTVRALHDEGKLPLALQRKRLLLMAERVRRREEIHEREADRILASIYLRLDARVGLLECHLSPDALQTQDIEMDGDLVRSKVLGKLVQVVSPDDNIPLRALAGQSARRTLDSLETPAHAPSTCSLAHTMIRSKVGGPRQLRLTLHRAPPDSKDLRSAEVKLTLLPQERSEEGDVQWSPWQLWDGRFWIRVGGIGATDPESYCFIRFLTVHSLATLRTSLGKKPSAKIDELMKSAKGAARFTLPAIFYSEISSESAKSDSSTPKESLVALPSLRWSTSGWEAVPSKDDLKPRRKTRWLYDIRYKAVHDSLTIPRT